MEEEEERPVKRLCVSTDRAKDIENPEDREELFAKLAEIWQCPVCHDEFGQETKKFTPLEGCKHPLCSPCFYNVLKRNGGRLRCDLCNKPWDISFVTVKEEDKKQIDYYQIPVVCGNIPLSKKIPTMSFTITKKSGNWGRDCVDFDVESLAAIEEKNRLLKAFPAYTKDDIMEKLIGKHYANSRATSFVFEEIGSNIVVYFVDEHNKLVFKQGSGGCSYLNVIYFNNPRVYLFIGADKKVSTTEIKMRHKYRPISCVDLIAIVQKAEERGLF